MSPPERPTLRPRSALALSMAMFAPIAFAQLPPVDGPISVTVNVTEPSPTRFDESMVGRLKVPTGFRITVFAKDMANVRWLQTMPNGDVYASRRDQGDVLLLRDTNRDGVVDASERKIVAQNLKFAHGLAHRNGQLYITSDKKVLVADIQSDGTLGTPRLIIDDLPDAGQHPNRTIGFGPDGMLYITAGSTCNDCRDANPESATMLRAQPDGSARGVFARGLRNTIGFGWHPISGVLYGFDNGRITTGTNFHPRNSMPYRPTSTTAGPTATATARWTRRYSTTLPTPPRATSAPPPRVRCSPTPRMQHRLASPSTPEASSLLLIATTPSWRSAAHGTAHNPAAFAWVACALTRRASRWAPRTSPPAG